MYFCSFFLSKESALTYPSGTVLPFFALPPPTLAKSPGNFRPFVYLKSPWWESVKECTKWITIWQPCTLQWPLPLEQQNQIYSCRAEVTSQDSHRWHGMLFLLELLYLSVYDSKVKLQNHIRDVARKKTKLCGKNCISKDCQISSKHQEIFTFQFCWGLCVCQSTLSWVERRPKE